LDDFFRLGVKRTGGLVKNNDPGIRVKDAGDSQALFLPT